MVKVDVERTAGPDPVLLEVAHKMGKETGIVDCIHPLCSAEEEAYKAPELWALYHQ